MDSLIFCNRLLCWYQQVKVQMVLLNCSLELVLGCFVTGIASYCGLCLYQDYTLQ